MPEDSRIAHDSAPTVLCGLRTRTAVMKQQLERIPRFARAGAPILVQGETGTGKELVARAIHALSDRRDKPMVVIDCAALPESLIESELFGHERGAFTGADRQYTGRLHAADGATIFLDEINAVAVSVQAKLLRFLETGEFARPGQQKPIRVDVRVVSASNVPLEALVASGRMRSDLFYRLNVLRIDLPPLRERADDIPLLVQQFLDEDAVLQRHGVRRVSERVLKQLATLSWPGNVRQLRNFLREAAVLGVEDGVLRDTGSVRPSFDLPRPASPDVGVTFRAWMRERERQYLEHLVARFHSVAQQVAMSGLPARTLYRKIRDLRTSRASAEGHGPSTIIPGRFQDRPGAQEESRYG